MANVAPIDEAAAPGLRKGVDLLVLNLADAEHGFEKAENSVEIIGEGGAVIGEASGSKREVAAAIWDRILTFRGEITNERGTS